MTDDAIQLAFHRVTDTTPGCDVGETCPRCEEYCICELVPRGLLEETPRHAEPCRRYSRLHDRLIRIGIHPQMITYDPALAEQWILSTEKLHREHGITGAALADIMLELGWRRLVRRVEDPDVRYSTDLAFRYSVLSRLYPEDEIPAGWAISRLDYIDMIIDDQLWEEEVCRLRTLLEPHQLQRFAKVRELHNTTVEIPSSEDWLPALVNIFMFARLRNHPDKPMEHGYRLALLLSQPWIPDDVAVIYRWLIIAAEKLCATRSIDDRDRDRVAYRGNTNLYDHSGQTVVHYDLYITDPLELLKVTSVIELIQAGMTPDIAEQWLERGTR